MAKEKRQHARVEISWPATVITPDRLMSCTTENLSPEGTLIRCPELPEILQNFRLVFKPAERQLILATAEKVWSKALDSESSVTHAMGVRFTFIPDRDHQFIKGAVSKST